MIDIGANLSHESFQHDLDEVLKAARTAGLRHIMVTGTTVADSERAQTLARQHPTLLSSTAGIHPHHAGECTPQALARLRALAAQAEVRALGETGLDFHRDFSPRPVQESAFEAQLDLACELGLPLFLHQRDAHERFMALLTPRLKDLGPVVVHCFTGSEDELKDYIAHDLYVGITGWICDERRGQHLHPLMPLIPENRLLLETDAPYLLPRTIRPKPKSRRNVPAHLPYVVETVAHCLNDSPSAVARRSQANAARFFGLDAVLEENHTAG